MGWYMFVHRRRELGSTVCEEELLLNQDQQLLARVERGRGPRIFESAEEAKSEANRVLDEVVQLDDSGSEWMAIWYCPDDGKVGTLDWCRRHGR